MRVTFLGTGTSQGVPVIGCGCAVCKSTDSKDKRLRVSILIETENETVVIDAGPDFRQQLLREDVQKLDAVVFTHEHKDHTAGLDDVRAFNFKQKKAMDVFAHPRVQEALKMEFSYIFSENNYPGIPEIKLHSVTKEEPFNIGELEFNPVEVLHYKLPVLGFRIGKFAYITDAKTVSIEEKEKLNGTEILVINALRREEHISHMNLEQALEFISEINPKRAYLTHISHLFDTHSNIQKELPPNVYAAYDGLKIEI